MSENNTLVSKCIGKIEINGEEFPCPDFPTAGGFTCEKHKYNYGQQAKKPTYTIPEIRRRLLQMRSDYKTPKQQPAF